MMVADIENLINNYGNWIKEKTSFKNIDEWVEITTPFLDRHNDHIQIYVQETKDGYLLTDDSYTINDLEISGCVLNTPKRKALLETNINGYGVKLNGKAIEVFAGDDNFAQKKHNLIQAILSIDDLFYTAQANVESLFREDVSGWLDSIDVRYSPDIILSGRSGLDHRFNFLIPKSKERPERILQAINNPTKESAKSFVFSWFDTIQVRQVDSIAYAILNDKERDIDRDIGNIYKQYQIKAFPYSEREEYIEEITA